MLRAGDQIGEYVLARQIGQGGFASVWLGRGDAGEPVAIKVLDSTFYADAKSRGPTVAQRFLEEARLLARIEAPGLVRVLEVIHEPDRHLIAIVMEKAAGVQLEQAVAAMSLADLLEAVADVADTLAVLHTHGVVHRDVKCENILVAPTRQGQRSVKLIDLGLAKDLEAKSIVDSTASGVLIGTLRTMAPECFDKLEGSAVEIDGSADQWSLGIVLYETISGSAPWQGLPLFDLIRAVQSGQPPQLNMHPRYGLAAPPAPVVRILTRCLERDPKARFPSMAVLAGALRGAAEEVAAMATPLEARPPNLVPPPAADTIATGGELYRSSELATLRPGELAVEFALPVEDSGAAKTEASKRPAGGLPYLPGGPGTDSFAITPLDATLVKAAADTGNLPTLPGRPVVALSDARPHVDVAPTSVPVPNPAAATGDGPVFAAALQTEDPMPIARDPASIVGRTPVASTGAPPMHPAAPPQPAGAFRAAPPLDLGGDPTHPTLPSTAPTPATAQPASGVAVSVVVTLLIAVAMIAFAAGWVARGG